MDSQRAGGYRLSRIPGNEPKARVVAAGEVNAGDLQVTTVQVTLVQRDCAVGGYLLEAAAPHGIVGALNYRAGVGVGEAHRTVFSVVDSRPDAGLGLDARLVTVSVEDGREGEVSVILGARDVRVLVKLVSLVEGVIACLHRHTAIAHVVVVIAVSFAIHLSTGEFGAGVVDERIVHHVALSRGRA